MGTCAIYSWENVWLISLNRLIFIDRVRRGGIKDRIKVVSIVKIWEWNLEIQGFDINTSLVSVETKENLFRASWSVQPPKGTMANYNGIIRRRFAVEGRSIFFSNFDSWKYTFRGCSTKTRKYGERKGGWIFLRISSQRVKSFCPKKIFLGKNSIGTLNGKLREID